MFSYLTEIAFVMAYTTNVFSSQLLGDVTPTFAGFRRLLEGSPHVLRLWTVHYETQIYRFPSMRPPEEISPSENMY